MIEMLTGHLGSGDWKIVEQDGVRFLKHRLPFDPKGEYRVGANEILDVQVERIKDQMSVIRITLTEDRWAQARVNKPDLEALLALVPLSTDAPIIQNNQGIWVKGFIVFVVASLLYELLR